MGVASEGGGVARVRTTFRTMCNVLCTTDAHICYSFCNTGYSFCNKFGVSVRRHLRVPRRAIPMVRIDALVRILPLVDKYTPRFCPSQTLRPPQPPKHFQPEGPRLTGTQKAFSSQSQLSLRPPERVSAAAGCGTRAADGTGQAGSRAAPRAADHTCSGRTDGCDTVAPGNRVQMVHKR